MPQLLCRVGWYPPTEPRAGSAEYEARRVAKSNKQISSNVIGEGAFDEGADRAQFTALWVYTEYVRTRRHIGQAGGCCAHAPSDRWR